MECGVSTSCFYPENTRVALERLQLAGNRPVEIFLNTFSELEPPFVDAMKAQLADKQTKAVALHPFSSGMETFFFASMYDGRLEDGLRLYEQYFVICQQWGISKLVFHGDYRQTPFSFRRHCENYLRLRELARGYGVELCQENVVRCKCGTPEYIRKMREYTREDVSFVLDIKQMRRAQVPMDEMLSAMSGHISHLHLSDASPQCDCAAPGMGEVDFQALFRALAAQGFDGTMVIELYRYGFDTEADLLRACAYIDACRAAAHQTTR
jgi:sugar phosphate isomerase/epimerase